MNMKKMAALLLVALSGCGENEETDCGNGEETILTMRNKVATIKESEGLYFLYFEKGIETGSERLQETIQLLLPSGAVKENPAYSSHTNYTDFFITKLARD